MIIRKVVSFHVWIDTCTEMSTELFYLVLRVISRKSRHRSPAYLMDDGRLNVLACHMGVGDYVYYEICPRIYPGESHSSIYTSAWPAILFVGPYWYKFS